MNLREMELFGTLMRVGTTIETARLLGISQPGVSAQLKRLESRLGMALFHRTGNRLEPTQEAEAIYALSGPIFAAQAQIRAKLPALRNRATRPLAISATPALVDGFLGPFLVKAGYGEWKNALDLRINSPEEDLRNGLADIGLQMAFPPKVEFHAYTVGSSTLVAVIREDHELARRETVDCRAISCQPLVCFDPEWSPMGAHVQRAFSAQGLVYSPACTVPYCANVCALVKACGGVGIVDEMTARSCEGQGMAWRQIDGLSGIAIVAFHRRNEPLRAAAGNLLKCFRSSD
ncbi:DNA-binding transcriptional LysR family regulator [Breoghania corrubedonensis]|uniref:DNA-binding transcriptional LysR family regulator n=1 Tax=Breoghania corrubedonensis TaxID=665038 RepID=A0A2T5VGK4_9HYPH|nr:LysR family transcriptional regulator [Breoghania corrubedonensis]PTW62891.1 DNA-binding transcriptional LysR family regulator [Breoghania corrubedonensis]